MQPRFHVKQLNGSVREHNDFGSFIEEFVTHPALRQLAGHYGGLRFLENFVDSAFTTHMA